MKTVRIGAGAGFSGDRFEPAVDLARRGELDFLVFECLAERTIARAQRDKLANPELGYDRLFIPRMTAVLDHCIASGVRIITNMGAAAPLAAMRELYRVAREHGHTSLRIAAVCGDDVTMLFQSESIALDNGQSSDAISERIVSANAYLGAFPIANALEAGADVVITGRTADPALFLGALIHSFGWSETDWDLLGKGTLAGHLLECAGQVTGGYFADPGFKDVPDIANLGFPIGEISSDGTLEISKLPGTGGQLTPATVKEQLLYEVHDPSRYLQPDVIADFSNVQIIANGKDRVRATGGAGHPKTGLLKVSVGFRDDFIGEGQISYGGAGAVERGNLALDIIRTRLDSTGLMLLETRYDLIGVNSLFGNRLVHRGAPSEVRARVAARTGTLEEAEAVGNEVEALYTNGPSGGGGVWKSAREVISVASALLPETVLSPEIKHCVVTNEA